MLAITERKVFHPRLAMFTYSTWSRRGTKVKLISCSGGHTRQSDDIGEEREGEKRVRGRIEGMEGGE